MTGQPNASATDSIIFAGILGDDDMRALWSDAARTQRYLDVERALAEAQAALGIIPHEAAAEIAHHCDVAGIDFDALATATARIGYPVLGVVQQLVAACADGLGQWCHWGATTQDVTDTAQMLQISDSLAWVSDRLDAIGTSLATLATRHRDTPIAARTNMLQAVPATFGYKASVWLAGIDRCRSRIARLRAEALVLEFGGAAGTLASLGYDGLAVQQELAKRLGLIQPLIAWHTMRDGLAEIATTVAILCGVLEKIALDVKIMASTEFGEVAEGDDGGTRGVSSTMPQKRNPISCAYITACAQAVRGQAGVLLAAQGAADFERATGSWQAEWIAWPQLFCLAAGAIQQADRMLAGLVVHEDAMAANLARSGGLIDAEAVMMVLAPKLGREEAHDRMHDVAQQVETKGVAFADALAADPVIAAQLDRAAIDRLLDPANYLGLSGTMVDRVLAARA